MIHQRLARTLIRLYPRRWRERYADELLVLVEDAGANSRTLLDLAWGAGRERVRALVFPSDASRASLAPIVIAVPLCVGLAISGLGLCMAMWLTNHVSTPARVWIEGGYKTVAPPALPSTLAIIGSLLPFVVLGRWALGSPLWNRWPRVWRAKWRIGAPEFAGWMVLLLIASTTSQWSRLTSWYETGVARDSLALIWGTSAVMTLSCVQFIFQGTQVFANYFERQSAILEAKRLGRMPQSPLGLNRRDL